MQRNGVCSDTTQSIFLTRGIKILQAYLQMRIKNKESLENKNVKAMYVLFIQRTTGSVL